MPTTSTVYIGGREFVVPSMVTGGAIKRAAGLDPDERVYEETPDRRHRLIGDDEAVQVGNGAVLDSILPHTAAAAGRDIQRVQAEIGLLCEHFGAEKVFWPADFSYVQIHDYGLPPNWSQDLSDIALLLPPTYGFETPIKHAFLEPGLRRWNGRAYRTIEHYFDGVFMPYGHERWRDKGWGYLCLHLNRWRPQDTIFSYLKNLYTFLDNPEYPWGR